MAAKFIASLEKKVTLLRAQRDPSLVHAGLDEYGEPFVIVDPSELTQEQRDTFAALFMAAAANFAGGSAGLKLH